MEKNPIGKRSRRDRIWEIIEPHNADDAISHAYDIMSMVVIVLSLVPLAFKEMSLPLYIIDYIAVSIFIIDYLLRWITADHKMKFGWKSFLLYPFTPMAIVDLLSILPSFTFLLPAWRCLKFLRLFRLLRVIKFARYSRQVMILLQVIEDTKHQLLTVLGLTAAYVMVSALVVFNVEPETFDNLYDAVYWATVSLTTIGYGDIYPTSDAGHFITMVSSLIGIAIVALPAGIITAAYMTEQEKEAMELRKKTPKLRDKVGSSGNDVETTDSDVPEDLEGDKEEFGADKAK